MQPLVIDFSGLNGLSTKHNGDLYSATAQPHLRYLASDGQMVSGIWNPFKNYGYLSPANKSVVPISGTITTNITSVEYDSINDVAYFAEAGTDGTASTVIQKLDGLDDTSLASFHTSTSTERIADLEQYQLNGTRVLIPVYDRALGYNYWEAGWLPLDNNSGPYIISSDVIDTNTASNDDTIQFGFTTRLAQKIDGDDVGGFSIKKLRLRLGVAGVPTAFNITVTIQADSVGSPSGTALATGTAISTSIDTINKDGNDVYFDLDTQVALNVGSFYWIVLTEDSLTESLSWYRTNGNNTLYPTGGIKTYNGSWSALDTTESYDFSLILYKDSSYWNDDTTGSNDKFAKDSRTGTSFIQVADNGFAYWVSGNSVAKLDGGLSGGDIGKIEHDVLLFPSYLQCVDAIDTNGLMYIGVNTGTQTGSSNTRTFNMNTAGVYVWDRQTTVTRTRDYIPLIGVKEVRKLYQNREGDIRVIVINNDRQVEIRSLVNSTWQTLYTLDANAYPEYRDSLTIINNYVVWQAKDGKIYANGKATPQDKEGLFIIGDLSEAVSGAFSPGIILNGNEVASGQQQALICSYMDGTTPKLSRFYLHGIGTIDSVVQYPLQGDIYTPVYYLPVQSTVKKIQFQCIPGTNSSTDVVATLKFYFNQSTTATITKTVTKADVKKGYFECHLNKSYVNSVQIELEYNESMAMSADDFCPSIAILTYEPTTSSSPTIS